MRIEDIAPVTGARGMCMIMPKLSCDLESVVKSKVNLRSLTVAFLFPNGFFCCAFTFLPVLEELSKVVDCSQVGLCHGISAPK